MPHRLRGRRLQAARRRLFEEAPLCVHCLAAGRVTAATARDHVVPLAEGGADSEANVQPLCAACHAAKSEAERQRGVEAHRSPAHRSP